jgi:hypothetical protein
MSAYTTKKLPFFISNIALISEILQFLSNYSKTGIHLANPLNPQVENP